MPKIFFSSDPTRAWIIIFRAALLLVAIFTINAVSLAVFQKELFQAAFPGTKGILYYLLIGAAIAGIISLAGMWFWQRWAAGLFAVVGVLVIAMDVLARAPLLYIISAAVSFLLILALVYRLRERFTRR